MASFKAIYRWLKNEPEFRAMYVAACAWRDGWLEFQAEALVGDLTVPFEPTNARVEALEGRRGRVRPKTYRAAP